MDNYDRSNALAVLTAAADKFVHHNGDWVEIWAASIDWFLEEWGRDTFISLPGLLLTTKRYEEARKVFRHFKDREQNGLIPNVIRSQDSQYNTADASLWYIHALKAYVESTDDWEFVSELLPTVRKIIKAYSEGTNYERSGVQYRIFMDLEDCLIVSPPQATWMDADPSGDGSTPITPRNGKCVEINALWYGALRFVIATEKQLDPNAVVTDFEEIADSVRVSFTRKLWNSQTSCLFDVIEGDPQGAEVRPNQIFAISHGMDLLDNEMQQSVLERVSRDLLTPFGLRTLSPQAQGYIGQYDTSAPMSVKDLAYHQGTIWPWLIGPYCDAIAIVRAHQGLPQEQVNEEIREIIQPLVQYCLTNELRSIPEVFSGDPPHQPGGTRSQAWSVAEVLRVVDSY